MDTTSIVIFILVVVAAVLLAWLYIHRMAKTGSYASMDDISQNFETTINNVHVVGGDNIKVNHFITNDKNIPMVPFNSINIIDNVGIIGTNPSLSHLIVNTDANDRLLANTTTPQITRSQIDKYIGITASMNPQPKKLLLIQRDPVTVIDDTGLQADKFNYSGSDGRIHVRPDILYAYDVKGATVAVDPYSIGHKKGLNIVRLRNDSPKSSVLYSIKKFFKGY